VPATASATNSVPRAAAASPAGAVRPEPELGTVIRGRVLSRNDQVRFVVVELLFSPLPEPGRRLEVYRGEKKVGELRASRWNRGALVVADIIHGDAQPGDDVRAD
jgi:hypothetical protein